MSKTPWGRQRLHDEGVASGRIKSATQQAEEGWLQNSPLSPAAKTGLMPDPTRLDPNSYQKKFGQDYYPGAYSPDPKHPGMVNFYANPNAQGGLYGGTQRQAPVRPGY